MQLFPLKKTGLVFYYLSLSANYIATLHVNSRWKLKLLVAKVNSMTCTV